MEYVHDVMLANYSSTVCGRQ